MHRIMVRPLMAGLYLTAIFDSYHSGAALDLPYVYSTEGILKEPSLANKFVNKLTGFFETRPDEDAKNRALASKTSAADVVMFSGNDNKTSSVHPFIAVFHFLFWSFPGLKLTFSFQSRRYWGIGVITWAFIISLKKNPQQSYVQLLNSIYGELAPKCTVEPQLSCSHPLSKNPKLPDSNQLIALTGGRHESSIRDVI